MEALIGAASDVWLLAANQDDIFFKGSPNGVFHPDSSEICSMCCNIALDTSPQSLHARFVARVLVWLSRGNLTITFPELSICDKSSTLSLINISYSFSDGELLSRTTFSDKCLRLVRFLITNDVLTSQHTRIAFAFACWNFLSSCTRMLQLLIYPEYTSGSWNKTSPTCLQTLANTIPKESLRCDSLNGVCDDK